MQDQSAESATQSPTKWSSRKFWLAVGCELLFTGLLVQGFVSAEVFADLTFVVLGGYYGGNVGEHWAKR